MPEIINSLTMVTLTEISKEARNDIQRHQSPLVSNWIEKKWLRIQVFLQLFKIVLRKDPHVFRAIRGIYNVKQKYQMVFGEPFLSKIATVDNRYFWRLAAPGFPSEASRIMQTHEVNRFFPDKPRGGLRSLIFSITNRCTLNCEHCFEWDNLNQNEKLTVDEIIHIVHQYQDFGTTQIMFSGGEPMMRIKDMIRILEASKPGTDFWIITSGIGFNEKNANRLKQAGLTGVMVSLDHHQAEKHNEFRGFGKAYQSVLDAVYNAHQSGIVTALSLCATRSFVTHRNLIEYMELAKTLGVAFVQILEPRAVGRYHGQDVALHSEQIHLLEQIYLEYNNAKAYADYPIIQYLGYHQRKAGCFGSGDRFFYINTKGEAQICPYCSGSVADARNIDPNKMIELLANKSCHEFDKNQVL